MAKLINFLLKEMAKVLLGINQEEYMKENGRMIKDMDLDSRYLLIITIISVNMSMVRSMVRENINGNLDNTMKVLGRKAKSMGLAIGKQKMEIPIQANGPITILMDMANINGQMAIFMKENGK